MRHIACEAPAGFVVTEGTSNALQKIIVLLRAQTGQDFSLYKKDTLNRRIKRRMDVHLIGSADDYVRCLQENPQEVDLLFKELLIGVTSFFRDVQTFEALKARMASKAWDEAGNQETLRAWVVGALPAKRPIRLP